MKTVYIYALVDPRDDTVRYVGKSKVPKQQRRQHIRRNITMDSILLNTSIDNLNDVIQTTIKEIKNRIFSIYGTDTCELTVMIPAELENYSFDLDEHYFFDKFAAFVYVLCKSANGNQIIMPDTDLSWEEYFHKVMLWQKGYIKEAPKILVAAPYLQARIQIEKLAVRGSKLIAK